MGAITRRACIKGAGFTAAALGAVGFTSVAQAAQEGLTYADTVAWDAEYDVVVIGFGGAGACSAIAAAEEGAKVLLTEKAPLGHEGGNTRYCEQVILHYDSYEAGMAYQGKAAQGFEHAVGDEVLNAIVTGTLENYDWLESVGIERPEPFMMPLGEYPEFPSSDQVGVYKLVDPTISSGKVYWNRVRSAVTARADAIDVWLEAPARHLIQDPFDKTILGVEIEREGQTLAVRAKNGVVLACGGFENDMELVENFTGRERLYPLGTIYNTGDGVRMALEVGASLWHMNALSGPWITVKTPEMDRAYFNSVTQNIANNGACIYVGPDGTRFVKESACHRHGHMYYSGNFWSQLSPSPMFAIFDQSAVDGGMNLPAEFSKDLSVEVEAGIVFKADSIAELAEQIGVNVDAPSPNIGFLTEMWDETYRNAGLVWQIEEYNNYCKQGYDPQFQRRPDTLVPIVTPPYYAIELQPASVNTNGGAKRDVECRVLNAFDNPIPHLYSAGEFGSFYGGIYTGGGNISETMFTGRVAGRNAAVEKDAPAALQIEAAESHIVEHEASALDAPQIELGEHEYLGRGIGIGGDVLVKVTMDGSTIAGVEVAFHNETEGIGTLAVDAIPQAIVKAQGTSVDLIAGATLTSAAIIVAVDDALTQAQGA